MDIQTFGKNNKLLAQHDDKKAGHVRSDQAETSATPVKQSEKQQDSLVVATKKQLNAAILQSTVDTSFSQGDGPMSLVLKTALEGINEALKETMGEDAATIGSLSGLDISPQATADRIVALSTELFGRYQQQHKEATLSDALDSFTALITSGIDKGFAEARDILKSLNVLTEQTAEDINQTYSLVRSGLNAFVTHFRSADVS